MNIVFQGDSITDVGRDRESEAGHGVLGYGYPLLVASRLLKDHPGKNLEFYNRGISGDRVTSLLPRWKMDALNLKPDILSIFIGINDIWHEDMHDNGTDLDVFETVYRILLEKAYSSNPDMKIILLKPFWAGVGEPHPDWNDKIKAESSIIDRLAGEIPVAAIIDTQALFDEALAIADGYYWTWDGVHPTPAGHQMIADVLLGEIERLL